MEPLSFPQKLCALKTCVPSFIIENSRTRNKSHSPQPPMRKRLYSEDFTFNLLDPAVKKNLNIQEESVRGVKPDLMISHDFDNPIIEETRVFPEDLGSAGEKGLFKDEIDSVQRNSSVFDLGLTTQDNDLTEEMVDYLPVIPDSKVKDYFTDIFDNDKKTHPFNPSLGKRGFTSVTNHFEDRLGKSQSKGHFHLRKRNLKVQENSTYLFKPKKVKPKLKEGNSLKQRDNGKKSLSNKTSGSGRKRVSYSSKHQKTQKVSSDKKMGQGIG